MADAHIHLDKQQLPKEVFARELEQVIAKLRERYPNALHIAITMKLMKNWDDSVTWHYYEEFNLTIKVIETGDKDWFKPGIHVQNPSTKQIADAKEDAINKGHDTVYAHRIEKPPRPPMTKRR